MSKILKFYCEYHLGDNAYHLHFCNHLARVEDVEIVNYMKPEYTEEMDTHVFPENRGKIQNLSIEGADLSGAENCWINREGYLDEYRRKYFGLYGYFDLFYIQFYNMLFGKFGLKNPVDDRRKFLFDHPDLNHEPPPGVGEFDVLVVNSQPFSGQWSFSDADFDGLITDLREIGKKVVVTKASPTHPNVPLTLDYNMTILDIGKLAKRAEVVLGIHTAPWLLTLNKYSIDKVKRFVNFQNYGKTYSFENVACVRNDFREIYDIVSRVEGYEDLKIKE